MNQLNYIGIIPARYASTRFPGKPLALIGNKPVIQHVYVQASKALETVVVATDDSRILDCVTAFGGRAVMTSPDHPCGTNRCWEAYEQVMQDKKHDVVINIQGDEPFIQPGQIELLKSCFPTDIATLVKPFTENDGLEALRNPNSPKVLVSNGRALYFSRSVIPYLRGIAEENWLTESLRRGIPYFKHIGMYAYRAEILEQIVRLPQSPLELAESLEQLRWLEAGYTIRVAQTDTQTIGIDTPEDLKLAVSFWEKLHNNTVTSEQDKDK